MNKAYSVIEILVVIGVFAVIGVLATQAITLSLNSTKKSDSVVDVKQELDNATENIGRLLQTANAVDIGVDCVIQTATPSIGFKDSLGNRGDVACLDTVANFYSLNSDKRIASSSGNSINYNQRLTSSNIDVTTCAFSCFVQNQQTYITLSLGGQRKGVSSAEGAIYNTTKKILVRKAIRR